MKQARSLYIHLLALVATAAAAALFYPQFSLNHDTSWYLIGTRMFLEGEQLYAGVVEINPPLAFYLTVPAIWIADSTGLTEATAFFCYAIAMGVLSSGGSLAVLRRSQLDPGAQHILFLGGLLGLFVVPVSNFGQREHLMLIFAAPYFLLLIAGAETMAMGWWSRLLFGFVATLGLALKPYFLLIPAIILIAGPTGSLLKRIFEPQNLGLGAGMLAYLYFVVTVHGEYLTQIVPMASLVYGTFEADWSNVFLRPELAAILYLCGLFAWKPESSESLDWRLLGGAIGALICYLVQFKGWSYQAIPLNYFITLATLWLLHSRSVLARRRTVFAVLAILILCLTLGNQIRQGPYRSHFTASFSRYVEQPGQVILVLSSNVSAAFPFVNEVQGRWASRYPAQWLVPGALVGKSTADCRESQRNCRAYDAILAKARLANIDDLQRFAPDLVFVDDRKRKSYFDVLRFDYLQFLGADPRFSGIWSRYEYRGTVLSYQVWAKTADDAQASRPAPGLPAER